MLYARVTKIFQAEFIRFLIFNANSLQCSLKYNVKRDVVSGCHSAVVNKVVFSGVPTPEGDWGALVPNWGSMAMSPESPTCQDG